MKYCSLCGGPILLAVPDNDDRERHVCSSCGHVHYQNPRIVTCSLPCFEDRVLMCKRSIEPRYGCWTLPGGFMENGETSHEAAIRETLEEAGARIEVLGLYTFYSLPRINQVHLFFRANLLDLDYDKGRESLKVALLPRDEIAQLEIAFPSVADTLAHYFEDLPRGSFPLRSADILRNDQGRASILPQRQD